VLPISFYSPTSSDVGEPTFSILYGQKNLSPTDVSQISQHKNEKEKNFILFAHFFQRKVFRGPNFVFKSKRKYVLLNNARSPKSFFPRRCQIVFQSQNETESETSEYFCLFSSIVTTTNSLLLTRFTLRDTSNKQVSVKQVKHCCHGNRHSLCGDKLRVALWYTKYREKKLTRQRWRKRISQKLFFETLKTGDKNVPRNF